MADDPTEPSTDDPIVDEPDADHLSSEDADRVDLSGDRPVAGSTDGDVSADQAGDDLADASPVDGPDDLSDATVAGAETGPGATDARATAPAKPEGTVVRKKVTSKRVTPKGAAQGVKVTSSGSSTAARATGTDEDGGGYSKRYTPPKATYAPGPSPWWVPALMFGLLIVGAVVIMANYMGAFGDAQNIRLVIGLAFILGGIITATQYR